MFLSKKMVAIGLVAIGVFSAHAGLNSPTNSAFATDIAGWGDVDAAHMWDGTVGKTAPGSLKLLSPDTSSPGSNVGFWDTTGNNLPVYEITFAFWAKTQANATGTFKADVHINIGASVPPPAYWAWIGMLNLWSATGTADWEQTNIPLDNMGAMTNAWGGASFDEQVLAKNGKPNMQIVISVTNGTLWLDDFTITSAGVGVKYPIRFESSGNGNIIRGNRNSINSPMTVLDAKGRVVSAGSRPGIASGIYLTKLNGVNAQALPIISK